MSAQQQILGTLAVPYPAGKELAVVNSDLARPYPKGTEPGNVVAK